MRQAVDLILIFCVNQEKDDLRGRISRGELAVINAVGPETNKCVQNCKNNADILYLYSTFQIFSSGARLSQAHPSQYFWNVVCQVERPYGFTSNKTVF